MTDHTNGETLVAEESEEMVRYEDGGVLFAQNS